jgi:hypothetical protein
MNETAKVSAAESKGSAVQSRYYIDGHPYDTVQYIEAKIILQGRRFTSVQSFFEFAKLVRKAAKAARVEIDTSDVDGLRPQIREVLFLDTKDFKLYNNAFILRRRINYIDGFLVGDPEIVFKYRHPDLNTASGIDVRPSVSGNYKIKFKEEVLPLKDRLGGKRSLYSHNVEFALSQVAAEDRTSTATLVSIFPALEPLLGGTRERVQLVNRTAVEEVLQELGTLDFGKGVEAPCNVAVWRTRGDEQQLVGEFSFQVKFERGADVSGKPRQRMDAFFLELQEVSKDWLALGTTKTGAVYRLKGNPPTSHE